MVWRAEVVAPHKQRSTRGASGKPRPTIEGKPGSATTSRHPPTQAAKKCGIGPQVSPVPPAESPVDGAGPQRGVKTGRRITIWNHLTPSGAPFSLDSKNRSFSSREKETGFEPYPPSFYVAERQWTEMWFGAPGRRAPHQSDAAIYLSIFSLTPAFPLGGLLPCWNCSPPPGRRRPSPPTGADRSRGAPLLTSHPRGK